MNKQKIQENIVQLATRSASANMLDDLGQPIYASYDDVPSGVKFNHRRLSDGSMYYQIKNEDGTWGDGIIPVETSKCYDVNFGYSNIPLIFKNKSFEDFDVNVYTSRSTMDASLAVQRAQKYVECFDEFYNDGMGLYIFSEATGSGKSLLACIIANQLMSKYGISVKFIKLVNLIEDLKKEINRKEDMYLRNDTMKKIIDTKVLIIDDLGTGNQSQFVSDIMYGIIDKRLNQNRVTIFTSRKSLKNLRYDDTTLTLIKERSLAICIPNETVLDRLISERNKRYEDILNA